MQVRSVEECANKCAENLTCNAFAVGKPEGTLLCMGCMEESHTEGHSGFRFYSIDRCTTTTTMAALSTTSYASTAKRTASITAAASTSFTTNQLNTTTTTSALEAASALDSSTNKTSDLVTNNSSKRGGTTAAIVIVVLLLVGVGVFLGRRQWLAHNAESNRREQAILELNGGGGGIEMVENPLARSASRTLATVPTYENVAEQQVQPANDCADVPPPLIPGSRHGAPRAAAPQLYSTPADLDPASLYKSPADAGGAAAAVQSQVQVQVYSVPTDGGNVDLYQPADGGHAYAESSTLNNGGDAGEGGGAEYANVHEDDDGVYSNA